jgi:two-component system chemotaxis response regulator CheB
MVSSRTEAGAADTITALELGAVDFIPKPEGAVSLEIDRLAPPLVEKVRAAAAARLPASLRLADRVRARSGLKRAERRVAAPAAAVPSIGFQPMDRTTGRLVLVGTSTGGPRALEILLTALPEDFPLPILIAQHMPAAFTAALAKRLDRICAIAVEEVSSPTPLRPGAAFIARGDADMLVRRQRDTLVAASAPADPGHRWHPSVDRLVRSAMALLPAEALIGVMMTGMGNDGAAAMAEMKQRGGRTLAEAEESAVVWGMPGELVKAGGAEVVAPLDQLARRLVEICG